MRFMNMVHVSIVLLGILVLYILDLTICVDAVLPNTATYYCYVQMLNREVSLHTSSTD